MTLIKGAGTGKQMKEVGMNRETNGKTNLGKIELIDSLVDKVTIMIAS